MGSPVQMENSLSIVLLYLCFFIFRWFFVLLKFLYNFVFLSDFFDLFLNIFEKMIFHFDLTI